MENEIAEILVFSLTLTWLIARESFSTFICAIYFYGVINDASNASDYAV
jgi:hypothetical protein